MRYFKAELDTRELTLEQEEKLIDELESVECDSGYWSCFPEGKFSVTPVQLPEFVNEDDDAEDNWIYGKLIVEGEVTDSILEKIYEVFDGVVPFTDNDPFDLVRQQAEQDFIILLMKKGISYDEYKSLSPEQLRERLA